MLVKGLVMGVKGFLVAAEIRRVRVSFHSLIYLNCPSHSLSMERILLREEEGRESERAR